ncbi:hypothetical protein Tco_0999647 [Tanacetum coccineum]
MQKQDSCEDLFETSRVGSPRRESKERSIWFRINQNDVEDGCSGREWRFPWSALYGDELSEWVECVECVGSVGVFTLFESVEYVPVDFE